MTTRTKVRGRETEDWKTSEPEMAADTTKKNKKKHLDTEMDTTLIPKFSRLIPPPPQGHKNHDQMFVRRVIFNTVLSFEPIIERRRG
jgi:hypothetical protein